MGELLGRPNSDGSYWNTNFRCVNPVPCPSEGILKIDLRINKTCLVGLYDPILCRSRQFPGTMRRADYYDRLLTWFCSLPPLLPRQVGTELAYEFTDRMVEYVFGKVNPLERMAIYVTADLNLVSWNESVPPFAQIPPELEEQDQTDDESMISGDDDEYVQEGLSEESIQELMEVYGFDATDVGDEDQSLGDCSICLDDLVISGGEDDTRRMLFDSPCCHVFHESCIAEWLRKSFSCPLCRFIIPSEMLEEYNLFVT